MARRYPVTADHFTKYRNLANDLHVVFNENSHMAFGFQSYSDFAAYQVGDLTLENLHPEEFHSWIVGMRTFNKAAKKLATFELICLAKHCLLTQTLGAKPQFTREPKL